MPHDDDNAAALRRPIISANWKMHNNHFEAIQSVQMLSYLIGKDDVASVDVSIHPPFTDIRSIQTLIDADDLQFILGAQNCHWEDKGAFTGEVSPVFLNKLGVQYVICGHSERRELFGETDEVVNRKVAAVHNHHMIAIMCVGETLAEHESDGTDVKVTGQITAGLAGRTADEVASMVIAYEPIWAIGTGRTATAEDAQLVCATIRARVAELFDAASAVSVRIQYGGSVKAANIAELMAQPDIDGALVGGASLDPDEFARIVQYRHH
ncbi:MAG: triose-phosphate isomerase [Ilumatobacteraceae bacterium]